jgi:glycerol-3-phosphate dehydrogenase
LAGKLSFGRSKPQSRSKTISKIPTVNKNNLRGSVLYHDGQFDDSRLGINMVQTIIEKGGTAINYMKVINLLKTDVKTCGVVVKDQETGIIYDIKSKTVLNATGVFVNSILKKDNVNAQDIVQPSQGVHLVIDKKFWVSKYALMIPKTKDGRVLFAVPWHNKIVLGTTDVPKEEALIEPVATDDEIDFILETAGRFLSKKPTRKDVKSVFAGLRPLAVSKNDDEKTKEISRGHKIYESKSGLISIIGGKWTTYRQMGEEVINRIAKIGNLPKRKSITETLHLHGYKKNVDFNCALCFYGSDAEKIKDLINENPNLGDWVSEELKINKAQVVWAVRYEFARSVEDVLARRTRALFLDASESIRMAPTVANIIAKELHYDNNWEKEQISNFTKLAEGYLIK